MEGVINVYKEAGWTSGDVVNKLKGVLHERRIGHCGTLDPDAEGVLAVCVGRATKLFDFLTEFPKTYKAHIVFGKTTDTQDGSGKVLTRCTPEFSLEELDGVIEEFNGDILQIPPMYSAIHKDGKRLYELARLGQTAEIEARKVKVYSAKRTGDFKENGCDLTVECGKGTYIRTICHDIGQKLGCGAYMEHLLRTSAAGLNIDGALKIKEIEERVKLNDYSFITPITGSIAYMHRCEIDPFCHKALTNGNPVDEKFAESLTDGYMQLWCNGDFFGIGKREKGKIYNKCFLGEIK